MTYRMTRTKPKVNIEAIINRLDPFTSDGSPKEPDHLVIFRSILEFILGKPLDRRHSTIVESLTLMSSGSLYVNGQMMGTGAELQGLLREWWDDRGMFNEGTQGPRSFQGMLDSTIGYQDGARRTGLPDHSAATQGEDQAAPDGDFRRAQRRDENQYSEQAGDPSGHRAASETWAASGDVERGHCDEIERDREAGPQQRICQQTPEWIGKGRERAEGRAAAEARCPSA